MSEEQRKDEETEVEAHHHKAGLNDEPRDEMDADADDEVEAHHHKAG